MLEPIAPRIRQAPLEAAPVASKFIVGVTSCPTGIAHTFMAAEALLKGAAAMGYTIKVETRGSVGAKNELTAEDIARADAVVVAADANVETTRFAGKKLLETGTKAAINDAQSKIREALAKTPATAGQAQPAAEKSARSGPYKHLMTGVSHMLPLVVAGGLMIALAFAVGGIYAGDQKSTLGWALMQIGATSAFALFVPIFAGFIAFSIADRPGLTPGLIGGMLASSLGAGFLGGMMAFDMGGPINKAAYTFAVGLVATKIYGPMAAGMVPPLAATLFKNRFTADEQQATKATAVLGNSFITEGAIPYAASDPLRVLFFLKKPLVAVG